MWLLLWCVAKASGFDIDEPLDMHDYACLRPILTAMIRVENGRQPYTDAQIDAALIRAGVMPPERSLQQTRTVKGGQVAAVGTISAGAIGAIQETVGQAHEALVGVVPYLDAAKWEGWLFRNVLTFLGWLAAAAAVAAVLFGARQAGRNAERVEQIRRTVEVQRAQLQAASRRPRDRGELSRRMRAPSDGRHPALRSGADRRGTPHPAPRTPCTGGSWANSPRSTRTSR